MLINLSMVCFYAIILITMTKKFSKKEKQELQRLRREKEMLLSQLKSLQKNAAPKVIKKSDVPKSTSIKKQFSKTDSPIPDHFDVQVLKSDLKRTTIFSLLIIATLIGISVWQK